jgi:hypothetical protein
LETSNIQHPTLNIQWRNDAPLLLGVGCWMLDVGCFPLIRAMNLLTELKEGLGISWNAIRANKLRSILTTIGIVIGVVTVSLMGTAIQGLNRAF